MMKSAPASVFEAAPRPSLAQPRPIDIVTLTTSVQTITTARTDADLNITALYASNVSGASATITVYIVPDGGTASTGNMVLHEVDCPPNAMTVIFNVDDVCCISPGASIQALASAGAALNVWGSGVDYQGSYQ